MPLKVKLPELSAVAVTPLLRASVVPAPNVDGVTAPEIVQVFCCGVKESPIMFAPFTGTDVLAGENEYPAFVGVIV